MRDWLANIDVYNSIEQAAQAMRVAIKNEPEEFDGDEEHSIAARDEVLVGLVAYLAHGQERILRILDARNTHPDVVDTTAMEQSRSPVTIHVELDGETLARAIVEHSVDVRAMMKEQQEREQNRKNMIDMAYRNCKE